MKSSKFVFFAMFLTLAACDGRREQKEESSTFRVERVKLEDALQGVADETGTSQIIQPNFKACIHDAVSMRPILNTRFAVSDGASEKDVTTDESGCLRWSEIHRINLARNQTLIQFRRWIVGKSVFAGTVVTDLVWNPWKGNTVFYDLNYDSLDRKTLGLSQIEEKEGFRFDSEIKALVQSQQAVDNGDFVSDDRSDLLLTNLNLRFVGLDKSKSTIDSLLTLKTAQKFEIYLEPKAVTLNLQKKMEVQDLGSGRMNVQIFLVRTDANLVDLKASDLVGHYSDEIQLVPRGGTAKEILMRIDDVAAIQSRNRIVVILKPLGDAAANFKTGVFTGYVNNLVDRSSTMGLSPVSEGRMEVLRQTGQMLSDLERSHRALDLFAAEKNVARDDSGLLRGLGSLDGNANKKTWISLCDKVFRPDQKIAKKGFFSSGTQLASQACRSNPKAYLELSEREFVESVKGSPRYVGGTTPKQISISRTLGYSRSESEKLGTTNSANGGVSLGLNLSKWGFGAKVGVGKEWYYTQTTERTKDSKVEANVADTESLSVVSDTYEVDASVRSCAILTGSLRGSNVLYDCRSATQDKTIRETYYVVRRQIENSPFTDDGDAGTSWRLMIRGEKAYESFEKMMVSENTVLNFTKWIASPDMKSELVPAFQATQAYPGLLEGD